MTAGAGAYLEQPLQVALAFRSKGIVANRSAEAVKHEGLGAIIDTHKPALADILKSFLAT